MHILCYFMVFIIFEFYISRKYVIEFNSHPALSVLGIGRRGGPIVKPKTVNINTLKGSHGHLKIPKFFTQISNSPQIINEFIGNKPSLGSQTGQTKKIFVCPFFFHT